MKTAWLLYFPSVIFLLYDLVKERHFTRYKTQLLETMVQSLQSCLEGQGGVEHRMKKGKKTVGVNEGEESRDGQRAETERRRREGGDLLP